MSLRITGLDVSLSNKAILQDINLEIGEGSFFSLLGPSGCGKSTLLKTICGFITPDRGNIILNGKSLNVIAPHKRNVVMVFQDMRLFPHLNIMENVAFGLKMAGVHKTDRAARASAMLRMVRLEGYEKSMVNQLSGGQQQRVALARALITAPAVLLLDEPFSGLDTGLRLEMRRLLSELHKKTGTAMVFVTHDYEEALSLSDGICVMAAGKIRQCGPPREVYGNPASLDIARYFCEDNIIEGEIKDGIFYCPLFSLDMKENLKDGRYSGALYPGAVTADLRGIPDFQVTDIGFMGDHSIIYAQKEGHTIKFKTTAFSEGRVPNKVGIKINARKIRFFEKEG